MRHRKGGQCRCRCWAITLKTAHTSWQGSFFLPFFSLFLFFHPLSLSLSLSLLWIHRHCSLSLSKIRGKKWSHLPFLHFLFSSFFFSPFSLSLPFAGFYPCTVFSSHFSSSSSFSSPFGHLKPLPQDNKRSFTLFLQLNTLSYSVYSKDWRTTSSKSSVRKATVAQLIALSNGRREERKKERKKEWKRILQ